MCLFEALQNVDYDIPQDECRPKLDTIYIATAKSQKMAIFFRTMSVTRRLFTGLSPANQVEISVKPCKETDVANSASCMYRKVYYAGVKRKMAASKFPHVLTCSLNFCEDPLGWLKYQPQLKFLMYCNHPFCVIFLSVNFL